MSEDEKDRDTLELREASPAYDASPPAQRPDLRVVGKEKEMKWWPAPDGVGIKAMPFLTLSAAEFKAKCLALMDDLEAYGGEITVTKRGRPVAKLVPYTPPPLPDLKGSVVWEAEDAWEPLTGIVWTYDVDNIGEDND